MLWAVDPGTLQSALVILDGSRVREVCTLLNAALLPRLAAAPPGSTFVCEQIAAMGMPVGNETLTTCWWTGRFYEAWPNLDRYMLTRGAIKHHLCGTMQAKDANVRMALLDRYGPGKDRAIGTIKAKGPLHGLKGHEFSALAVGIVWLEQHGHARVQAPLVAVTSNVPHY
jgi:hypothetical protein